MNKYSRIFIVFTVISLLFTFCSCNKLSTELSDTMIIQGIGIDEENGNIKVTVEILNNLQSGSPNGEGNSPNKTYIFSSSGKTVSEAVNNITLKSGNTPLYAHNRVIVIGESAAEKGIEEISDFFSRDYDSNPSMLVCIAKNRKASEIIDADLLEDSVKGEVLENILKMSARQSFSPLVKSADVSGCIAEENECFCIPAVTVVKRNKKNEYTLDGCGVFNKNNKLLFYLDKNETQGYLFLRNEVDKGNFSVEIGNRTVSFLIVSSETKYKVKTENGYPVYYAEINTVVDINEISKNSFDVIDNSVLNELRENAEKEIREKVEKAFNKLTYNKTDALKFGKRLSLANTRYYKEISENYESIFKNSRIATTENVTVRRTGDKGFFGK